jgi:hypothetical protein
MHNSPLLLHTHNLGIPGASSDLNTPVGFWGKGHGTGNAQCLLLGFNYVMYCDRGDPNA